MKYFILTLEYALIPISYDLKMSPLLVKFQIFLGGLQRLNTQLYRLVKIYTHPTFISYVLNQLLILFVLSHVFTFFVPCCDILISVIHNPTFLINYMSYLSYHMSLRSSFRVVISWYPSFISYVLNQLHVLFVLSHVCTFFVPCCDVLISVIHILRSLFPVVMSST